MDGGATLWHSAMAARHVQVAAHAAWRRMAGEVTAQMHLLLSGAYRYYRKLNGRSIEGMNDLEAFLVTNTGSRSYR